MQNIAGLSSYSVGQVTVPGPTSRGVAQESVASGGRRLGSNSQWRGNAELSRQGQADGNSPIHIWWNSHI